MAGPPDHRALPSSTWRPHDAAHGGAPRDGDFARLLEAASAPAAHRMKVDPEVEAWGSAKRTRPRAPHGSPGMNWGRALPLPGRPAEARRDRDATTSAPPGDVAFGASAGTRDDGVDAAADASDRTLATMRGDARGFGAGPTGPARSAAARWSARPLRDRVVAVLFAVAGLWILLNVLDASTHRGGGDLGALVVLAVVAFFVLRGWMRGRRPPTDSR